MDNLDDLDKIKIYGAIATGISYNRRDPIANTISMLYGKQNLVQSVN
jgi:hypothetical protein